MTRLRPKLIVMTLVGTTLLWPSTAESPVGAAAAPAAVPVAAVTVQHEFIRVGAAPSPPRAPRQRLSLPAVRLASGPPRSRPAGLALRAGRALMGDGRYRPEPFPRLGR